MCRLECRGAAMLTKAEKAWVAKIQKLLDNPPSDRLGFYTIGDPNVSVYDRSKEDEMNEMSEQGEDWCGCVRAFDADLGSLRFPASVHSTAG